MKTSEDELLRILNDPDAHYTPAPEGVLKYAAFMHDVGRLKGNPASWKDLFFPPVHGRPGS
jgi:NitT/TauT family transport system substrate-binding protein